MAGITSLSPVQPSLTFILVILQRTWANSCQVSKQRLCLWSYWPWQKGWGFRSLPSLCTWAKEKEGEPWLWPCDTTPRDMRSACAGQSTVLGVHNGESSKAQWYLIYGSGEWTGAGFIAFTQHYCFPKYLDHTEWSGILTENAVPWALNLLVSAFLRECLGVNVLNKFHKWC